jgi:anti-sigma factor ChrR (cupin superfamily)
MISEQQEEQASLYALGALTASEERAFETELSRNAPLRQLVHSLQRTTGLIASATPDVVLPLDLKKKVMQRIGQMEEPRTGSNPPPSALAQLRFAKADDQTGWKQLPIPGAWIKLLSLEKERGYAVLMGKLEAGARYPAHVNAGPEDFFVLTGDLHIGDRRLGPGDFHHAEGGSQHEENFSIEGCTLLAVLTTADPLVAFAMA